MEAVEHNFQGGWQKGGCNVKRTLKENTQIFSPVLVFCQFVSPVYDCGLSGKNQSHLGEKNCIFQKVKCHFTHPVLPWLWNRAILVESFGAY